MTDSDVDDLVRWLDEQFDEDERIARVANTSPEMVTGIPGSYAAAPVALLIAEFAGPARVLREIDAKRQILRALESAEVSLRNTVPGREPHELMTGSTNSLRAIVRMLATVYADRPGYREAWRL